MMRDALESLTLMPDNKVFFLLVTLFVRDFAENLAFLILCNSKQVAPRHFS